MYTVDLSGLMSFMQVVHSMLAKTQNSSTDLDVLVRVLFSDSLQFLSLVY